MSDTPRIFIFHSPREQRLAAGLANDLALWGYTVFLDTQLSSGDDWQRCIERAIAGAEVIIVMLGEQEASTFQRYEWSLLLQARWNNPNKRLIPLLLGDARAPSFLSNLQGIRVKDPKRDWKEALTKLVRVIEGESVEPGEFATFIREDPSERRERLRRIEEAARSLKTH